MIIKSSNHLQFFVFSKLGNFQDIRHGVFTRGNGFSQGHYHSLNAGLSVGDAKSSVVRNRNAIARCMGAKKLVFANQVHKRDILILKNKAAGGFSGTDSSPVSADAMVTDIPGMFLAIQLADCQGILMYDPQKKVVAGVHSGWRGSIQNIPGACVDAMRSEFGCRPENVYAGISPSLGPCCSEFIHYQQEIPEKFWCYKNPSDHFDFWKISFHQLQTAGLLPQHIEISNICTKCNSHLFFSFRKNKRTGRFVSVIGLK